MHVNALLRGFFSDWRNCLIGALCEGVKSLFDLNWPRLTLRLSLEQLHLKFGQLLDLQTLLARFFVQLLDFSFVFLLDVLLFVLHFVHFWFPHLFLVLNNFISHSFLFIKLQFLDLENFFLIFLSLDFHKLVIGQTFVLDFGKHVFYDFFVEWLFPVVLDDLILYLTSDHHPMFLYLLWLKLSLFSHFLKRVEKFLMILTALKSLQFVLL